MWEHFIISHFICLEYLFRFWERGVFLTHFPSFKMCNNSHVFTSDNSDTNLLLGQT